MESRMIPCLIRRIIICSPPLIGDASRIRPLVTEPWLDDDPSLPAVVQQQVCISCMCVLSVNGSRSFPFNLLDHQPLFVCIFYPSLS